MTEVRRGPVTAMGRDSRNRDGAGAVSTGVGVRKSPRKLSRTCSDSLLRLLTGPPKNLPEITQCALHRKRRHADQPAQRSLQHVSHRLSQAARHVALHSSTPSRIRSMDFDPARQEPIRHGGTAAGFDGAEFPWRRRAMRAIVGRGRRTQRWAAVGPSSAAGCRQHGAS